MYHTYEIYCILSCNWATQVLANTLIYACNTETVTVVPQSK